MISTEELRDKVATLGSNYLTDKEWIEVIDRLEVAEKSDAESLMMYRKARDERDALRSLVVMRFDHDHPPQFVQGYDPHDLLEPVTAEQCRWLVAEIERLRAKVEAMEKQGADTLMDLDGAQPAQKEVAYLDLGVGGYMDLGTDLNDEQLASLPKGRHMLGIVGTYGVDGYVSAQPAPSVPEGWKLVPIEPTPEMMLVAQKANHDHGDHEEWLEYDGEDVKRVYRAMLAAAPEAKP